MVDEGCMVDAGQREKAGRRLVQLISDRGGHLSTGEQQMKSCSPAFRAEPTRVLIKQAGNFTLHITPAGC